MSKKKDHLADAETGADAKRSSTEPATAEPAITSSGAQGPSEADANAISSNEPDVTRATTGSGSIAGMSQREARAALEAVRDYWRGDSPLTSEQIAEGIDRVLAGGTFAAPKADAEG
jgi:hypothetical protein